MTAYELTLHGSWTQIMFSFLKLYFPHLLPMFLTRRLQTSLWETPTIELPSISRQVLVQFCLLPLLCLIIFHGVPDTRVIWGLNLGQNNLTAAFLEAKSLVEAFASPAVKDAGITLDAIEIGNEANRYQINGARPTTYTPAQYVKECVYLALS